MEYLWSYKIVNISIFKCEHCYSGPTQDVEIKDLNNIRI
jgi:hypothetical protein